MKTQGIDLGSVQETLLLPLWGRAVETRKANPLLVDDVAVKIVDTIDYDFAPIVKTVSPLIQVAWIARSIYFDEKIEEFLQKHPSGTIVNVGCGLDTTYDRVNNGTAHWFELDLPEVIEFRKRYIQPNNRRVFIAGSVLDDSWYSALTGKGDVLLLFAGVIYYFTEDKVKALFNTFLDRFGGCDVLFDYASVKGMNISNKRLLEKSGMDTDARLRWGIDDIHEIEKWNRAIRVIETMPLFTEHRKKYPFIKRMGMILSDRMKVMSLAHVEIRKGRSV